MVRARFDLLLVLAPTAAAKGIRFSLEVERPSEAAGELVRVTLTGRSELPGEPAPA